MYPDETTPNHLPDPEEIRLSLNRFIGLLARLCAGKLNEASTTKQQTQSDTRAARPKSKTSK